MSETFKQRFDRERAEFDKDFDEQRRSIERNGKIIRAVAIGMFPLAIIFVGVAIYVAAHFIGKFW